MIKNLKKDGILKDSAYMIFSNMYSKFAAYLFYFLIPFILGTEGFGIIKGLMPILDTLVIIFVLEFHLRWQNLFLVAILTKTVGYMIF